MRRFWRKKCRIDHLRSLWRSVMLVTVRKWQHSAVAEGRWESLTKCGVTESMTVRRVYDGPSCRFVMKFREVIRVPIFQEFMCFRTKTLDGPSCLWRSVILAVEGNEESSRRNCTSIGRRSLWRSVVTTTIRHMVRRSSKYLSETILQLRPTKWVVTIDTNLPIVRPRRSQD